MLLYKSDTVTMTLLIQEGSFNVWSFFFALLSFQKAKQPHLPYLVALLSIQLDFATLNWLWIIDSGVLLMARAVLYFSLQRPCHVQLQFFKMCGVNLLKRL